MIVVCEDVKVPWEYVFTHDDIPRSRGIYFQTPAHTLSNHQAHELMTCDANIDPSSKQVSWSLSRLQ